jgi:subtilisin family serine protease
MYYNGVLKMEVTTMQFKRNLMIIVSLVFLVFSAQLLMGSQFNNDEEFDYSRLTDIASKKGYVRVIVEMDVPGIEVLTAVSTRFKTGNRDIAFIQDAYDADLALDNAISMTRNTVLHQLNGVHYQVNRTYSTLPCIALTVTGDALEKLKSLPGVLRIFEDRPTRLPETPEILEDQNDKDNNDISKPLLENTVEIVGAEVAWGFGYTGEGWYVAALDTGIRTTHEMFRGKHIVEHCFALGEDWYDKENGDCPNGKTEMDGPGSAAHYPGQYGHGSHVTGIAAGNDHDGLSGVAKDANIIAIQVFSFFWSEGGVLSWSSDQLKGLEYVYMLRNTYKIASVNMSLGSAEGYSEYCPASSRAQAISNLRAVGIATVIAAGNEGRCNAVGDPACIPGAVTVNATDKQDHEYLSGNWHDIMVDLMAPGVSIRSAAGTGDSSYYTSSGTSNATPHVTGAWAIMKQFNEDLSIDEILTALQETGTMITSYRCEGKLPKPRINIGNALISLFTIAPPLNLTGEQHTNRSFLQTEYINELTWESNPYNVDKNISLYRIYVVDVEGGGQLTRLGEVDRSTFTYLHRRVNKREPVTYAITAVDSEGNESPPYHYTLEFGVVQ